MSNSKVPKGERSSSKLVNVSKLLFGSRGRVKLTTQGSSGIVSAEDLVKFSASVHPNTLITPIFNEREFKLKR